MTTETKSPAETELRCPACGRFVAATRGDSYFRTLCSCRAELVIQVVGEHRAIEIFTKRVAKNKKSVI